MKTPKIFIRSFFFMLLTLFLTGHSFAQSVVDPANSNSSYETTKRNLVLNAARSADVDPSSGSGMRGHLSELSGNETTRSSLLRSQHCFIDLDTSYTAIPINDDGSFGPVDLPFTYSLYGDSINSVWINTNGNLTFANPLGTFSPSGFPYDIPMVAPFWADVDTRDGGQIYYKRTATHLIVTWDSVAYYDDLAPGDGKHNTFQVIISDGMDPITGPGQNTCFNYKDMQWTTGTASEGIGGFGGFPATVGVNKGNEINHIQVGRFGTDTDNYDGPTNATDGVHYLDSLCQCFRLNNSGNIPPSVAGFSDGDTLHVNCGDTANFTFQFIGPEPGQIVSSVVDDNGVCGVTSSITNGSISTIDLSIAGSTCNEGINTISITATDNDTLAASTTINLVVNVANCPLSKLAKCFCNGTIPYALNDVRSYIFSDPFPGAVRYEFLVVNDSLGVHDTIPGGFDPGVNPRYTSLVALPPSKLYYSATYSVSVRYQDSNNNWSAFGSACDIATPALPVPRVCGQYCGNTLPAENTPLSAVCEVPVIQRTAYRSAYQMEFRFVNLANNDTATTIGRDHPWGRPWIVSFAQLDASFVQPNTTYSVDVRVRINGVWGVYGPDCLLTTPANTRRSDSRAEGEGSGVAEERTDGFFQSDIKEDRAGMTVYPNPGKEGSEILLSIENPGKTYNAVDVMVLDVYGKQVYHKNIRFSGDGFRTPIQFDRPLTPGMYFVYMNAGEIQMSRKLIIR